MRFADLIARPPAWSDEYYGREKKQEQLDQIIDTPYFGESKEVALIQFADLASFFLRRYAEIKEGLVKVRCDDEEKRVTGWAMALVDCSIGRSFIYPRNKRGRAANLFYGHAPGAIRDL